MTEKGPDLGVQVKQIAFRLSLDPEVTKRAGGGDRKAPLTPRSPDIRTKPNLSLSIPNCKVSLLGFKTHGSEILEW